MESTYAFLDPKVRAVIEAARTNLNVVVTPLEVVKAAARITHLGQSFNPEWYLTNAEYAGMYTGRITNGLVRLLRDKNLLDEEFGC